METEIWKDIPGYEGLYQVSSFGNVKSLNYRRSRKEGLLKPRIGKNGYGCVELFNSEKKLNIYIHHLVMLTFLNYQPDGMKMVINHIDNNPSNNRADNLELVSQRYNTSCHKSDVGIIWDNYNNKWKSYITINTKLIHLGYFTEKEKALDMYQKALQNIDKYNGSPKEFREYLKSI